MIVMIDYGAGNIHSVAKAFETLGADIKVSDNPSDLAKADKIVLPGVGAFGQAADALHEKKLVPAIWEEVDKGKPFFGICIGFHVLLEEGEEDPGHRGIELIKGTVPRFRVKDLKVPHLGWNQVTQVKDSPIWKAVPDGSFFYFAHSYHVQPMDESIAIGRTDYGIDVISAIQRDNIFGIQFHPEKSQKWGLKVLKNFIDL